jgi:hypothetical protein
MRIPDMTRLNGNVVASSIAELYPDDEATGFSAGDFRGVFWVEFPDSGDGS